MRACLLLSLALTLATPVQTQTPLPAQKAATMTEAHGTFDVKAGPKTDGPAEDLASYTLDKVYHGELDGTGKGGMISSGDPASGNAGYVAMERITGTLGSSSGFKTGSFALMQQGTMIKGSAPQLTVTIVPGSGTGELSGIYGSMTITIVGGKHSYVLFYNFAQ